MRSIRAHSYEVLRAIFIAFAATVLAWLAFVTSLGGDLH